MEYIDNSLYNIQIQFNLSEILFSIKVNPKGAGGGRFTPPPPPAKSAPVHQGLTFERP